MTGEGKSEGGGRERQTMIEEWKRVKSIHTEQRTIILRSILVQLTAIKYNRKEEKRINQRRGKKKKRQVERTHV